VSLAEHARRELVLSGQYAEDPEYSESIIKAVEAFASYGHSGGSASVGIEQLYALLRFKTLSPLTSDPAEWVDQSEASGRPMWQNRRDPSVFSQDGGQTWYSIEHGAALRRELTDALNGAEDGSNTPDFVLAEFLSGCLAAFDRATVAREDWYGHRHEPGQDDSRPLPAGPPTRLTLGEVDQDLVAILRAAGDKYGPMGVAEVAAMLTDIPALFRLLNPSPVVTLDADMPPGGHDLATDSAGRMWMRDADEVWWVRPRADAPWYRQADPDEVDLLAVESAVTAAEEPGDAHR
jgi:hypothetical protein